MIFFVKVSYLFNYSLVQSVKSDPVWSLTKKSVFVLLLLVEVPGEVDGWWWWWCVCMCIYQKSSIERPLLLLPFSNSQCVCVRLLRAVSPPPITPLHHHHLTALLKKMEKYGFSTLYALWNYPFHHFRTLQQFLSAKSRTVFFISVEYTRSVVRELYWVNLPPAMFSAFIDWTRSGVLGLSLSWPWSINKR